MKIDLSITVRGIQAADYRAAKAVAWIPLSSTRSMRVVLGGLGIFNLEDFLKHSRAAKEADGTFTVTIP